MAEGGKVRRKLGRKKRVTQPVSTRYPELENMLRRAAELKAEGVKLSERHRAEFFPLEERIIEFMKAHGIKAYEGDDVQGGWSQSHTTTLDWNGLQGELPKSVWLSLLDPPQPSQDKLKAAMELGQVDADIVKKYMTVTPNKAYIQANQKG